MFFFAVDLDECTLNTDNCHDNATCTDTQGSFDCTCNSGFTGNGISCLGQCCYCLSLSLSLSPSLSLSLSSALLLSLFSKNLCFSPKKEHVVIYQHISHGLVVTCYFFLLSFGVVLSSQLCETSGQSAFSWHIMPAIFITACSLFSLSLSLSPFLFHSPVRLSATERQMYKQKWKRLWGYELKK